MNVNKKEMTQTCNLLSSRLDKMKISENNEKKDQDFGLSVSILIAMVQDVHNIMIDIKKINKYSFFCTIY